MEYKLKFNDINEIRQLKEDFTIKNLLDELKLSSQNIISKKNGEFFIVTLFPLTSKILNSFVFPLRVMG